MLKVRVSLTGLDKGEKVTKDKLKRVLMKSMFKMEALAIQKAPVDRGEIRTNITLFPQILADKYILESKAKHSEAMEFGTRPFYAPIKPLKDWAKRKLGDEGLGYAVQAKIAKFGVNAQPYMRPSLFEIEEIWLPDYAKEEFR